MYENITDENKIVAFRLTELAQRKVVNCRIYPPDLRAKKLGAESEGAFQQICVQLLRCKFLLILLQAAGLSRIHHPLNLPNRLLDSLPGEDIELL